MRRLSIPASSIQLPEDGPALAIVMTITNTWLENTFYRQTDPVPTGLVIEESMAHPPSLGRHIKLAMSLSCIFAFHRYWLSDYSVEAHRNLTSGSQT